MTTNTEDLQKILAQLDSGNDDHWTDDGAPSLKAVQQIGNDTSITRDQLNKAIPGFSRAGTDEEPVDEVVADIKDTAAKVAAGQGSLVEPRSSTAPVLPSDELEHEDAYNLDVKDPLSDVAVLPQDKLKEIMARRVENAQARLRAAQAAVTQAQAYVVKAETFVNQNVTAFNRAFPPMHPMDAIKQHLASQMQQRAEAAGRPELYDRQASPSPIDARMAGRQRSVVRPRG
jgi:hypothetical protein